jgi:DNA modification methylase
MRRIKITPEDLVRWTEVVPLSSLRPHPDNPNNGDTDKIGRSLAAHGQFRAIGISQDGYILFGNHTYMSAMEADPDGSFAVHRIPLDHDDPQAREILAAENRAHEGSRMDNGLLEQLLTGIRDSTGELDGSLYDDKFLAELIAENAQTPAIGYDKANETGAGEAGDATTMPGDLWILGPHRLLCGSGTDADHLARLLDGRQARLIVTSPPYNQRLDQFKASGRFARDGDKFVAKMANVAYSDSLDEEEYQQQQRAALLEWNEILVDGGSMFYNHKNRFRDKELISPLQWLPGPFRFRQEIVWRRPGGVAVNARMFIPSDERIYWLYKGADFLFNDTPEIKGWCSVWDMNPAHNAEHAAPFPIELPARCILACSRPGDLVLDPYGGTGTTLIAADLHKRVACLMELEPRSCDLILRRYQEVTGTLPILSSTGEKRSFLDQEAA